MAKDPTVKKSASVMVLTMTKMKEKLGGRMKEQIERRT